jgi:hypothetical protein
MGSRIVKSFFFRKDQLIHVMRFPTTISSRVGLARDSAMESCIQRNYRLMLTRDMPLSQQRAFIIRAPTLEATSHLTFDIPGDGPTWHFLARISIKAAATQNSDSDQCTGFTDGFHRVKCRAHVSRVVKMSPPAHPPPPPNCIISTPKIDAE